MFIAGSLFKRHIHAHPNAPNIPILPFVARWNYGIHRGLALALCVTSIFVDLGFFLGDHGPLFSAQERHEWVCAWLDSTWVHQSYGRSDDVLDVQASWKPQDECLSRTRSDLKKSSWNKFLGWTVRENLRRSWTKPYGSLCNDSFTSENNTNTQQIKITCFW